MEKDDLKIDESLMSLAVALKNPIPKIRDISQMEGDDLKIDESLMYLAVALKRPQIPYTKIICTKSQWNFKSRRSQPAELPRA